MNLKKRNFFALMAWMLAISLYSLPIINAAPGKGKNGNDNGNSGTSSSSSDSSSDDDDDDMQVLRNPSVTSPDRKSSSFVIPQVLSMGAVDAISNDIGDYESRIPDQLRIPLNFSQNVSGPIREISTTGINVQQSTSQSAANINSRNSYIPQGGIASKHNPPMNPLLPFLAMISTWDDDLQSGYTVSDDGTVKYGEVPTPFFPRPIFICRPTIISGTSTNPKNRDKVHYESLVIAGTHPVIFRNLDISGKIQVQCKANVVFENCNIHNSLSLDKTESAVKISDGSKAIFEGCTFDAIPEQRVCVIVRGKCFMDGTVSEARFSNCTFNDHKIGVFSMDDTNLQLFNCEFSKGNNISVFATVRANAFIKDCTFSDIGGKAIFLKESNAEIESCKFIKCAKGAITGDEESTANLIRCEVRDPQNTSVRFINRCKFNVLNCYIDTANGNCINIDSSEGNLRNCNIYNKSKHPTIAITGVNCHPTIENCYVEQNCSEELAGNVILTRNPSFPIFKNNVIRYIAKTDDDDDILDNSNLSAITPDDNDNDNNNSNNSDSIVFRYADFSSDTFSDDILDDTANNTSNKGFSLMACSNFSHPTLIDNSFEIVNSNKIPEINVFDGAKVKFLVSRDKADRIKEDDDRKMLPFVNPKNFFKVNEKNYGVVVLVSTKKNVKPTDIFLPNTNLDTASDNIDMMLNDTYDENFFNCADTMIKNLRMNENRKLPGIPGLTRNLPRSNSMTSISDTTSSNGLPRSNSIAEMSENYDGYKLPINSFCGHYVHCPICNGRYVKFNHKTKKFRCWKHGDIDFSVVKPRCNICNFLIDENDYLTPLWGDNGSSPVECIICREKDSNTISLKCGHMSMCSYCANKHLQASTFRCPECNENASSIRTNFPSNDKIIE